MCATEPRRLWRGAVLAALLLAACSPRPLTETERAFTATILPDLDTEAARLHRAPSLSAFPMDRPPRPRVACQDRIFPPETEPRVRTTIAGFVWRNRIVATDKTWEDDYLPAWPDTLPLADALFFAHEMTHVWQWQNREVTGYAPLSAAREHGNADDPYLFTLDAGRGFLDYGYEQQAALVEEFVCCRALDPDGARTDRLHALLAPHLPGLTRDPGVRRVTIPWAGAETKGICSDA